MSDLDDEKKKIVSDAEKLLKEGLKRMDQNKIIDLFDGHLDDELYVNVWLDTEDHEHEDGSTCKEHMVFVQLGFMNFSVPASTFIDLVKVLNQSEHKLREVVQEQIDEEEPPENL